MNCLSQYLKTSLYVTSCLLITVCFNSCGQTSLANVNENSSDEWKNQLIIELQKLGQRNWIVIAEPAYSAYTGSGATTILSNESSPETLSIVLNSIESLSHVEPRIYTTLEMDYIHDEYAPGVGQQRDKVYRLTSGRNTLQLKQDILDKMVSDAAKNYKVLIVKTKTALPYSNVYLELGSGYWDNQNQATLEHDMSQNKSHKKASK